MQVSLEDTKIYSYLAFNPDYIPIIRILRTVGKFYRQQNKIQIHNN